MQQYTHTWQCRRIILDRHFDGDNTRIQYQDGEAACDHCMAQRQTIILVPVKTPQSAVLQRTPASSGVLTFEPLATSAPTGFMLSWINKLALVRHRVHYADFRILSASKPCQTRGVESSIETFRCSIISYKSGYGSGRAFTSSIIVKVGRVNIPSKSVRILHEAPARPSCTKVRSSCCFFFARLAFVKRVLFRRMKVNNVKREGKQ
ncbi:hypothetical protein MRB53_038478 [Persea americana]|nr:hypothetical protein MRB53_038478 [Persea americana]